MSASDIMISVAVRISVRVCQQVTSCEFACKSSNTDGAKQQTFQAFNTTTLAYNSFIFTVATTYRENVNPTQPNGVGLDFLIALRSVNGSICLVYWK